MLIQTLRLKKGWSQQQLAEASGLSVRTIQRIEAGQPASTETLKSIAAVFEVDFSTLTTEPPMDAPTATAFPTTPATAQDLQEKEAFEYVRRLRSFYLNALRFAVILAFLTAINLYFSPQRLWVLWVAFGMGIALLFQGSRVFGRHLLLGPEWERREVEKRLGRPL